MSVEAIKLAIEALKNASPAAWASRVDSDTMKSIWRKHAEALEGLQVLLAELDNASSAEPVAWLYIENGEVMFGHPNGYRPPDARPLVFGDTRPAPGVPDGYALVPTELPDEAAGVWVKAWGNQCKRRVSSRGKLKPHAGFLESCEVAAWRAVIKHFAAVAQKGGE